MHAEPRRKNQTIGAKWLRQGGTFSVGIPANGEGRADKEVATNSIEGDITSSTKSRILKDKHKVVEHIMIGDNQGNSQQLNIAGVILNQERVRESIIHATNNGPSTENIGLDTEDIGLDTENIGLIITNLKRCKIEEPNQIEPTEGKKNQKMKI